MRCPSCGVPITPGPNGALPAQCPFCKSSLASPEAGSDALAKVREALARGNKILAIKEYRSVTRVGLAEAKAAVEAMEEGREVPVPAPVAKAGSNAAPTPTPAQTGSAIPWMLIVAIVFFAAGLATGLYVIR